MFSLYQALVSVKLAVARPEAGYNPLSTRGEEERGEGETYGQRWQGDRGYGGEIKDREIGGL
jgi:hypothetical protein